MASNDYIRGTRASEQLQAFRAVKFWLERYPYPEVMARIDAKIEDKVLVLAELSWQVPGDTRTPTKAGG